MARPEKYTTHVKPHLDDIKTWREQGMKLGAKGKQCSNVKNVRNGLSVELHEWSD